MSRRRAPVPDVDGPNLDQEWAQEWDEVVDIVCVGVGTVALAVGVAAERVGLDVLVTDSAGTRASVLTGDAGAYLAQLLDDNPVPNWRFAVGATGTGPNRPPVCFFPARLFGIGRAPAWPHRWAC